MKKTPLLLDAKILSRNNALHRNMFNFLTSKKISCKLIDLNPRTNLETDHIENLITQGKYIDRLGNEFYFQLHLDQTRLKLETSQPQVIIYFQYLINDIIKIDVDTNGQLFSTITQYLYIKSKEDFIIYKSIKENKPE